MTSKRPFGAIRHLPSGSWQARYRSTQGRLVAAPVRFASKTEAQQWLSSVETDQLRGRWVDPTAGNVSLEEYAWSWLATKLKIGPRTREIYEVQLRLHVLPEIVAGTAPLGPISLNRLAPHAVRGWYAALLAAKGKSTAAKAYTRLRQILAQAVDDDRIAKNPCRIDGGGAERHPEQRFATLAELYALAAAVPARYRALILTAGLGGLRQGELLALRVRDLDLLHGTIAVRRKRLRLASGVVIEDDPKSEAGRRVVALPSPLVTELDQHLREHVGRGASAYVFTSPTGEPIEPSNFRYRVWLPAVRGAGMDGLRFHDLRHTAGTLAARTGATTKELMARLGHASPQAAMIYQHAAADRDRLIAERLADMTIEAGLAPVIPMSPREVGSTKATRRR